MSPNQTTQKKIMIVDNERDIASTLAIGINRKLVDVTVEPFTDPFEAIDDFKRNSDGYDLVITDVQMPKMTGFDLYRQVKKIRSDVPVWFLSAFELTKREISSVFPDLKVERVLRKPIAPSSICELILEDLLSSSTQS